MSNATNTAEPTMKAPESGVRVRMYRPRGLGDCFLLAFRAWDGTGRYMLIDCGVYQRTKGGADRMRKIARDVADATGQRLHVLVATHEHWDHLSGFQFAESIFDDIAVDDVWLAWTEDPTHSLAKKLREKRTMALAALHAAVGELKAADDPLAGMIEQVLGFHVRFDPDLGISSTAEQWEYVRKKVATPHYCRADDKPLTLPGVAGIRIYVLGPPENEQLLSKSDPSTEDSEVYQWALALDDADAVYGADMSADELGLARDGYPFDPSEGIPLDQAEKDKEHGDFFRKRYGFDRDGEEQGPDWRRIDTDWLRAAGELALKLDEDTNNTSLTLAIELVESGKVLLFCGDAQVGNWLSWHDASWTDDGGDGESKVSGSDLIQRTVLYKVGHHGSQNATLREKGLEMMRSPDLVAMIPVDEKQARKKDWLFPFPKLLEGLQEKTRGRIIRADTGLPKRPESVPEGEWEVFSRWTDEDHDSGDKLWVEYTVSE